MGPKMEPWGTPIEMDLREDKEFPMVTHCFLPDKYDLNQSSETPLMP